MTGVSRSGRVCKKSSKLMDFQAADEMEPKPKRSTPAKKQTPKLPNSTTKSPKKNGRSILDSPKSKTSKTVGLNYLIYLIYITNKYIFSKRFRHQNPITIVPRRTLCGPKTIGRWWRPPNPTSRHPLTPIVWPHSGQKCRTAKSTAGDVEPVELSIRPKSCTNWTKN